LSSLITRLSQVKDIAKSKGKAKDTPPILTEACAQAQAMVDAGEEVTPELLSRLLKLKMMAHREEVLAQQAEAQKNKDSEVLFLP
jgi:hypothetical protein